MSDSAARAIFLSYASQDAEAARRLCEALRGAGVEVWFDQEGGLEHGDEWDAKIRRQIKECVLFVPVVSANTQAREEGYFRIEWELAAERAMGIASGVPFILPVVIDETTEAAALVPDRFRKVQWTRLPGGHMPPDVLGRVLKLWSHRTGVLAHAAAPRREPRDGTPIRPAEIRSGASAAPWRVTIGIAAVVLAGLVVAGWWLARSPRSDPAPAPAIPVATAPKAPAPAANEVQQLLARVRAICEKIGFTRDELALAEDLARRATELEPTSSAAWAVRAFVSAAYLNRGWDISEKRSRDTQSAGNRALALNPEEPEALLALGIVLSPRAELAEVETFFRRAMVAAPQDSRPRRMLGNLFSLRNRSEEAVALLEEAIRVNPRDALAYYNLATHHAARGNLQQAWQQTASALAITPAFSSAQLLRASLAVRWKGDLVAMRQALDQVPAADRGDDRAVYFGMWGALLERNPERVFAAGGLGTNEYLVDNLFTGPKAWLRAEAYAVAGKANLAQREWQLAEGILRQRMLDEPEQVALLRAALAYTLARLGRLEEAAREIDSHERVHRERPRVGSAILLAQYHAARGDAAAAAPYLRFALKQGANRGYGGFTAHLLRLEPTWDPLRGQPAFEQVLAEAQAVADQPKP